MKCRCCGKKLRWPVTECDNCGAITSLKPYIQRWCITLLALVLLVSAVAGALSRLNAGTPDEGSEILGESSPKPTAHTQTRPKPTDPVQTDVPTLPSTDPTIAPTEQPTDPVPPPTEPITDQEYNSLPNTMCAWIHSPDNQWYYDRYKLDASQCIEGYLYIFHYDTGKATQISSEEVILFDANYETIYYVTQLNPQTVICSTLDGTSQTELQVGMNITYLDYFGGIDGKIGFVANHNEVYIHCNSVNQNHFVFTYPNIERVSFDGWNSGRLEFSTTDGYWVFLVDTGEIKEIYM